MEQRTLESTKARKMSREVVVDRSRKAADKYMQSDRLQHRNHHKMERSVSKETEAFWGLGSVGRPDRMRRKVRESCSCVADLTSGRDFFFSPKEEGKETSEGVEEEGSNGGK
ncbi:hypothetical protein GW17_00039640 [Ensete ventricosum]|nr:hypothetical protein GW17_00039640 [Ensete ventricosum]